MPIIGRWTFGRARPRQRKLTSAVTLLRVLPCYPARSAWRGLGNASYNFAMDVEPNQDVQQYVQPDYAPPPQVRVPFAVWLVVGGAVFAIAVAVVVGFATYISDKSAHAHDDASYQNGYDFALQTGRDGVGRADVYGQMPPESVCWKFLAEARRSNTPPSNDEDFLEGCNDGLALEGWNK